MRESTQGSPERKPQGMVIRVIPSFPAEHQPASHFRDVRRPSYPRGRELNPDLSSSLPFVKLSERDSPAYSYEYMV